MQTERSTLRRINVVRDLRRDGARVVVGGNFKTRVGVIQSKVGVIVGIGAAGAAGEGEGISRAASGAPVNSVLIGTAGVRHVPSRQGERAAHRATDKGIWNCTVEAINNSGTGVITVATNMQTKHSALRRINVVRDLRRDGARVVVGGNFKTRVGVIQSKVGVIVGIGAAGAAGEGEGISRAASGTPTGCVLFSITGVREHPSGKRERCPHSATIAGYVVIAVITEVIVKVVIVAVIPIIVPGVGSPIAVLVVVVHHVVGGARAACRRRSGCSQNHNVKFRCYVPEGALETRNGSAGSASRVVAERRVPIEHHRCVGLHHKTAAH